jgi:hypothetical protein
MRAVSPVEVLALWEHGCGQSRLRQASLWLARWLDQPVEEVSRLSIGQRDFALLNLRAALFGREMAGLTVCPACHESVELRLNTDELASAPSNEDGEALVVVHDGYEARFRLPTSLDLGGLPADVDPAASRQCLLERCLLGVRRGEAEFPCQELPEAVVTAIANRMAEADPLADIQLTINCPKCRHRWEVPLDIVSFLWSELDAWAGRSLTEVHLLASAYGWSEHDILALSPARRQFYLRLITG